MKKLANYLFIIFLFTICTSYKSPEKQYSIDELIDICNFKYWSAHWGVQECMGEDELQTKYFEGQRDAYDDILTWIKYDREY